jgi:hypothetical protein
VDIHLFEMRTHNAFNSLRSMEKTRWDKFRWNFSFTVILLHDDDPEREN